MPHLPVPGPLTVSTVLRPLPQADERLQEQMALGLERVEQLLRASVQSTYPFVTETSRHLLEAGGKRTRPMMVLLASQFGDPSSPGVVPAAVAIELTHLSTLYHDDVMDEASMRRGVSSANARWGNAVAILTGDFLFARASGITADLGGQATRILADTIAVLCEGQIRETVGCPPGRDPLGHYITVIEEKTASLIATSCHLGARLAGADEQLIGALTEFGNAFGVAFQLSDDLLDVTSDSSRSGKTPGTDLREGIRTLPMLYALRGVDPSEARLRELLEQDLSNDEDAVAETLALLRASSAVAEARDTVAQWANKARQTLAELPAGNARDALDALCTYVIDRAA